MGPIPSCRSSVNLSVVIDDIDDVHPLFWKTYENGEPFGIVNRKNIPAYARMGVRVTSARCRPAKLSYLF
ncbi:MAG: hypothetical protein H7256_13435 [Bdellovibrio sp.]|nr:hypothetical protein [Bdellovibrio sp.]